jgi:hypothetical protein
MDAVEAPWRHLAPLAAQRELHTDTGFSEDEARPRPRRAELRGRCRRAALHDHVEHGLLSGALRGSAATSRQAGQERWNDDAASDVHGPSLFLNEGEDGNARSGLHWRIEKDGTRTVLADRFEGKRFSVPNDLAVRSDGAVYFTDGNSGLRGGATSPARELERNGFYLIKDGRVTLLDDNRDFPDAFPNGIALSPDEQHLYVTFGRAIVRYDVRADGTVANRKTFLDVPNNDGLKVDRRGNVYSTTGAGPGEVRITAPDGRRLGTIQLPDVPGEPRRQVCATNVGFGDADAQGLYITACNRLFRIRLTTPGVRPGPTS